jgi:hypothetical protein
VITGRSRPLFGSAIVVAAMLLSACYNGDADSPDTSRGAQATAAAAAPAAVQAVSVPATPLPMSYPDGVVVAPSGPDAASGVFPEPAGNPCCWLSAKAHFAVSAKKGSKALRLAVYVVDVAGLATGQSVSLVDAKGKTIAERLVHLGPQSVTFPVPSPGAHGTVEVTLVMGKSVVPKDAGLNGDVRRLSVMLSKAELL